MSPERWQEIEKIFHAALQLELAERPAFLERSCDGDEVLRKEVESLLTAHEKEGSFMNSAAVGHMAEAVLRAEEFTPGQRVGHYDIIEILGKGGMGEVYLAQDTRLGRKVALKFLPIAFTQHLERLRRFEQEARTASALNHPNILTVHEIGEKDGRRFIATEFVDGETLRDRLDSRPLEIQEALELSEHIASALAAAQTQGIIHRDIKPENVMLRRDGIVKVLDFGLAKLADDKVPAADDPTRPLIKTGAGVVMGTAQYMSPEQARGQEVDGRTDIFSLGVVLYEMITGHAAFTGETASDLIASILKTEPSVLRHPSQEVPPELERIVTKALEKDRDERYQTVKDMQLDLRRLKQRVSFEVEQKRSQQRAPASSDPGTTVAQVAVSTGTQPAADTATLTSAHTASSAEYIVTEIKRHKRGVLLALLLIGMAGVAATYLIYRWTKLKPNLQSFKITRLTNIGKATRSAISPDGRYVVYSIADAGRQSLWLNQVAISSNVQIVPPAEVSYTGITVSPDGNLIYYVIRNVDEAPSGVLYEAPALGGREGRKLLNGVHSPVALSPDGKRLAFFRRYPTSPGGDALMIANIDGTDEKTLITIKKPDLFGEGAPAWSPDGKLIAFGKQIYSERFYSNVIGVRVADGAEMPISSQRWPLNMGRLAWRADGRGLFVTVPEQPGSVAQVWLLEYPNGEATRLVNDLDQYSELTLTSDSNTLAVVRTNRLINIWVAPGGDSGRVRQITSGEGREDGVSGLDWTPDGRIVLRSAVNGSHIWIMSADGTSSKQLTTGDAHNGFPSVTVDGRYVVWGKRNADGRAGQGVTQLWRMDIDGSDQRQLTGDVGAGAWFHRLSPDGRWVVYGTIPNGGVHSLWKVSIDGGAPVQLTHKPSWVPVVSPDGRRIACNWLNEATGKWDIAILPFEGGLPSKILENSSGGYARRLLWTPDGKAVAFTRLIKGIDNIWAQPIDGGPPKQLTDFKEQRIIFNFAWSKDGKQLALSQGTLNSDVVLISGFK